MNTSTYSVAEQFADSSSGQSHLVILGAGASVQAFPNGDKWGNVLPVMNNLVETVGLANELDSAGIAWRGQNFEDIFEEICTTHKHTQVVGTVESRIRDYFGSLELPDAPTVYDYLVLSLREKDVIATFNWDPFLLLACARNREKASMPKVRFLHGCAAIGVCREHRTQGYAGACCPHCHSQYQPTRLLYPVANKDYVTDSYIADQWQLLKAALNDASILTIFGYGAPTTDKAAVDLMSQAWGSPDDRSMEEVELIDIKDEDELLKTWNPFIHSHHYQVTSDFFDSLLAKHPRRTCEAMRQSLWEARFREYNQIEKVDTLDEMWRWFEPLIAAERKRASISAH
jgi:hypothetical protein